MTIVVPLAGPDFVQSNGSLKALTLYQEKPLIESVLNQRNYTQYLLDNEKLQYVFIFQANSPYQPLTDLLDQRFPGNRKVFLSTYSGGALYSALAATSMIQNPNEHLVVDLIDIAFKWPSNPFLQFKNPEVGGILPVFTSHDPGYSYAVIQDGFIQETKEKVVISEHASAGVYIFRDLPRFLLAASGSIADKSLYFKNIAFLCPAMNGLIRAGQKVSPFPLTAVDSLSLKFHI